MRRHQVPQPVLHFEVAASDVDSFYELNKSRLYTVPVPPKDDEKNGDESKDETGEDPKDGDQPADEPQDPETEAPKFQELDEAARNRRFICACEFPATPLDPPHVDAPIGWMARVSPHSNELHHNMSAKSGLTQQSVNVHESRCNGDPYPGS